jgi:hypothetical protein
MGVWGYESIGVWECGSREVEEYRRTYSRTPILPHSHTPTPLYFQTEF